MNRNIITSSLIFISLGIVHAESFNNLAQALASPERVTSQSIKEFDPNMKQMPTKLGALINLKELEISCLENLEDIPVEIGQLKKLEKLIIDNGNACLMNVSIPASIGEITNLKVLRLFGALGPGEIGSSVKPLPATISKLKIVRSGRKWSANYSIRNFKSKKLEEIRIGLQRPSQYPIVHR